MAKLAFVMPNAAERKRIDAVNAQLSAMRKDQQDHFMHLVSSWGIYWSDDPIPFIDKAVRRVYRDRP